MNNIQYIEEKGKKAFAVVPIDDFERLVEAAEHAEDMHDIKASAGDETFPQEFVKKLTNADNLLPVWREYRGMTQKELHEASGIGQGYIAQIETGKKTGSAETLLALAESLNCDIEDIIKRQT
jgi:DNA-binding XRE family transcriptional regulator